MFLKCENNPERNQSANTPDQEGCDHLQDVGREDKNDSEPDDFVELSVIHQVSFL